MEINGKVYQVSISEKETAISGEFRLRTSDEYAPMLAEISEVMSKPLDHYDIHFNGLKYINSTGSSFVAEILKVAKKKQTKVVLWEVSNTLWNLDTISAWKLLWPRTEVHIKNEP